MGGDASKYNNEKNLSINIESNKVCYFPGEIMSGTITLFPFLQSFEKIMEYPKLNITINELKHYSYTTGSGKHKRTVHVKEEKNLVNTSIEFVNYVSMDFSAGFKIPFSVQIPDDTYPSINFGYNDVVRHSFIVELPEVEAKRTKIFAIKNNFPKNRDNTLLKDMIEEKKNLKNQNYFLKKGLVY